MLSRSLQSSLVGRSAAIRRQRRRVVGAQRLFCSTNGCASFLELDPDHGIAVCPICGYRRPIA